MHAHFMQDPNEKVQGLLTSMKKPTEKQALALSKLFPASKKFNPHAECVAKAAHAKKKKFSTAPKLSSVTVVLLKKYQTRIPRGDYRQELIDKKRMKKVELHRRMSPEEVKGAILKTFGCKGFTVLDSAKGGYLLRSDDELTANIAIDRRGALYLCEVSFIVIFMSDS